MENEANNLISIRDLKVHFPLAGSAWLRGSQSIVKAVDGVSLDIRDGETLGLVGESGCGKSTLGRAILRLTEPTSGKVLFRDHDLASLSNRAMREHRRHLQIIFQDPYASLNPRMTVGQIVSEPIETFRLAGGEAKKKRVQELLEMVGLSARFLKRYPHEFRCVGAGGRSRLHRRGRTDLSSRRVDPGADYELARSAASRKE